MKRSFKKAIAFIVAMALIIPLFSNPAISVKADASDFVTNGYTICEYVGKDTKTTLPVIDKDITYAYLSDYDNLTNLEDLTLAEGYSDFSISSFNSLKKLTLPSSLTTIYIYGCNNLKEITIPANCTSVSIYNCDKLEKINFEKPIRSEEDLEFGYTSIFVSDCAGLKEVSIPNGFNYIDLAYCSNLETIKLEDGITNISVNVLPSLKSMTLPESVTSFAIYATPFTGIKSKSANFDIDGDGIYSDDALISFDTTKETVNVRKGTREIRYQNLSGGIVTTTINLPDSVERICDFAFSGATSLKNLNIPKNVLTIGAYAFEGTAIENLVIPASVRFVDESAFSYFKGNVTVDKDNKYLISYEKGLYTKDEFLDYTDIALIYYPSEETSIKFMPGITRIGTSALVNSSIKKLDLPDTVTSVYFELYNSKVESINIPASVNYMDSTILSAPNLKKFTVDPANEYYTSYKNCLYKKDMSCFIKAPTSLDKIEIYDGCLSASYYALDLISYDPVTDEYKKPTVTIPKSVLTMGYITCGKANIYVDSVAASVITAQNEEELYWSDIYGYDPEPSLIKYEFLDSAKDILSSIYVIDGVSVKKGKKTDITIDLPDGLTIVKKLSKKTNTEVTVKFSSSNKKIAKVNATTGKITGVKKGTCTINVKFTLNKGKKAVTKTFKVKVKVK